MVDLKTKEDRMSKAKKARQPNLFTQCVIAGIALVILYFLAVAILSL